MPASIRSRAPVRIDLAGGCLLFWAAAGAQIIDFNVDRAGLQTWRVDSATGRVL